MKKRTIVSATLSSLSLLFFATSVQASSVTSQRVCLYDGEYAVFAQHPLFFGAWNLVGLLNYWLPPELRGRPSDRYGSNAANLELSHEHIFFCSNRSIVDNVGFGPEGRFQYSLASLNSGKEPNGARVDNFVPINRKRYDSNIVRSILNDSPAILPTRCILKGDGKYEIIGRNCQNFTDGVRKVYDRIVLPEITQISCNVCSSSSGRSTKFSFTYKDRNDDALRWEISSKQNPNTLVLSGNLKDCEAKKSDSCGGVGSTRTTYSVPNLGGNCKQNNKQNCVHQLQLVVVDKEGNRSKSRPFTLRVSSQ